MDSPSPDRAGPSPGARRHRRTVILVGGATLVIVVGVGIGIDLAPGPMFVGAARSWLREKGVDSAIDLTSFSDHGLSARVRLGDARDPDLTIERLDLSYSVTGPWAGKALGFRPISVHLKRPRLRVRLRDGKADFGRLSGLVEWALRQPPSGQPPPSVRIEDGEATVSTAGGSIRVTGAGTLVGGRLGEFGGRVAPFRQRTGTLGVDSGGGDFAIASTATGLNARMALGRMTVVAGPGRLEASDLGLVADLPPLRDRGSGGGPVRLDFDLGAATAVSPAGRLDRMLGHAVLAGSFRTSAGREGFAGVLVGRLTSASASGPYASASGARLDVDLADLRIDTDAANVTARSAGRARLAFDHVRGSIGHGTAVAIDIGLADGELSARRGGLDWRANLSGQATGQGGASASTARRLVQTIPVLNGERPYARALATALADVRLSVIGWRMDLGDRRARFTLTAPALLHSASGALLEVSGQGVIAGGPTWRAFGGTRVALSGGDLPTLALSAASWSATPQSLEARLAVQGRFILEPLGPSTMDLQGRLAASARQVRFDLDGCAPLSAQRPGAGDSRASAVALRLCPAAAPLWSADTANWRATGRVENLAGDAPGPAVGVRDAALAFTAGGGFTGQPTARVTLERAVLVDRSDPLRFQPLTVSGAASLDHDVWKSEFAVVGALGRRLGGGSLSHSMASGAGHFDVVADGLDFAPGGLQPSDLTPLATGFRGFSGHAGFRGSIDWFAGGVGHGSGDLVAKSLQFTGPLGLVRNLEANARLTSLSPPVSAPDQVITIGAVETVTPITDIVMTFDFDADAARVKRLSGTFAGGVLSVEPLTTPLSGGKSFGSAVVLHNVDLGEILDASNLSDKIKLRATVDGRIPFDVGPGGIRIDRGTLAAVAPGRISISRSVFTGAAGTSATAGQTSFAQDFAYQAMENLSFESLDATFASQAHDRLGILFHIKGRHDPPTPQRAMLLLSDALRGQALSKPMQLPSGTKIDLTLDTSLNFGELVSSLQAAWTDAFKPADATAARQQAEHP